MDSHTLDHTSQTLDPKAIGPTNLSITGPRKQKVDYKIVYASGPSVAISVPYHSAPMCREMIFQDQLNQSRIFYINVLELPKISS